MTKRSLEANEVEKEYYEGSWVQRNKRMHTSKTIIESDEEEQELLKTINKKNLNFDLEKVCSITLLRIGIYCCLTCGKFYQGRSAGSEANKHSIEFNRHKLYINLDNLKIYCLPENKEFIAKHNNNHVISDIQNTIDPRYSQMEISELNTGKTSFDLVFHKQFKVGFRGLNNFPSSQLVILHLIAHIDKIRDFFLLNSQSNIQRSSNSKDLLLGNLMGQFLRKYWSDKPLHSTLSPFALLNHVNGERNAQMDEDPKVFLTWLLNALSACVMTKRKSDKKASNVLTENLQGKIKIRLSKSSKNSSNTNHSANNETISKFWYLTLPLPDKDIINTNSTNQVSLNQLLTRKFDQPTVIDESSIKKYEVTKFPEILILHFERFGKNINDVNNVTFNDMIVKFDSELLNFGTYFHKDHKYKLISNVVVAEKLSNVQTETVVSSEIEITTKEEKKDAIFSNMERISWKIQLLDPSEGQWYEIDRLNVKKINKNLLFLNDTYIQVYQKVK